MKSKNPRYIFKVIFFSLIAACKFVCLTKGGGWGRMDRMGGTENPSLM